MATCFGRIINFQKGESNSMTEAACGIFHGISESSKTSMDYVMMILSEFSSLFCTLLLLTIVCAGNFPWLTPFLRCIAQQTKICKYYTHLSETASMIIQERRKQNDPRKVCNPPSYVGISLSHYLMFTLTFIHVVT